MAKRIFSKRIFAGCFVTKRTVKGQVSINKLINAYVTTVGSVVVENQKEICDNGILRKKYSNIAIRLYNLNDLNKLIILLCKCRDAMWNKLEI